MKQPVFLSILLLVMLLSNASKLKAEVPPEKIPCSSIANLDLQNITINNIKFVDGEACTSDSDIMSDCDWEHEISGNELLKPVPDKEVRIIIINSNHKTGSGAWDTVLVFDCINGAVRKVFENKYLYGVKIEKITDGEFLLTSGAWQPKDPMCCPTKDKHERYQWDSAKGTYILESTTTSKKKLQ